MKLISTLYTVFKVIVFEKKYMHKVFFVKYVVLNNNMLRCCLFQVKAANPFIGNPDYEVIASVFNFDAHDVNKDKLISKTEFAQSEMVPMEDVDHLFTFADANSKLPVVYTRILSVTTHINPSVSRFAR